MNKILEEHLIKLDVQIKELHFAIVLPAKITFSIHVDSKPVSDSRKVYYLQNQSLLPFQRHACELTADFDTKKNSYLFKQISLVTHYQGAKGLEGSRRVKFDPFVKAYGDKEWVLPSQNSPQFKVVFVTSFSIMSKKAKSSRVNSNLNDPYKYGSLKKEANMDKKQSAINQLIKSDEASKRQSQANQGYIDRTKRLEHIKSVPIQSKKRNTKNRLITKYAEQSDQLTAKPQDQLDSLRKKIELQREEKVRSITKLKMEVSPNFLPQDKQEGEVNKLKQKIRNLQRKEQGLQSNIEELNSELQKRKNKIGQLQKKKDELQKGIVEKDVKLKTVNATIRSLNQQIQSFISKERVNNKKAQTKEAAYRDQLRKLQEKLRIYQLQISKANQQKTNNIKGIQFCQKIHQNALKEKQIKMSEQKSKFNKQKEEFIEREKILRVSVEELNSRIQSLQFQRNQFEERINQLQQRQFNYENEIAALKESIKLQREENDKQLDQRLAKLSIDINNGRVKNNQLTSQANLLKEKVKRLENIKAENDIRIKQLEETLKGKSSEMSRVNTKMTLLKQQLDNSNEENSRRMRQIDSLKHSNTQLKQKLGEARQKGQEQKRAKEQANNMLDKQLSQFNKYKQSYQSQIKELKWSIIRNNDSISELQYQLKQQKNTVLKLTEQQMAKSQTQTQLQDKIKQAQYSLQMTERQKNNLLNRIRELNEAIKIKNLQLQQQKKQRIKADHKYEEQRQKLRQHISFSKQREAQQQERKSQRQSLLLKKEQDINKLELQLAKKRQQINSLKNSCDSVLREVHLSKMDNDTIKGQLNILQSNYKALKQQNINLQQSQHQLTVSLAHLEQSLNIQNKKAQFLQKEYDEYKQNIERAFQNLCSQLFKEQANSSNVIAASLLPFPTQKLSNLQVQLIQKRNNFIIKYRQKVSDLQNQNDALQHQIQQIKQLYQTREQAAKNLDSEQRQKLKGLLYEGMMQKNGINEQLIVQRKERQQLQKQIEKLKVLLYKKEDMEQQLNGQLQILLLEYDGIKAQNQDLNNIVFKYKTLEIQNKAEFDRTVSSIQEEYTSQIDKLKLQALDKDRKIIQVQKQLSESNQRTRKIEEERFKLHGLLELSKQSNRILQQKVSQSNIEITKLNNVVKGLQKKEGSYKEAIDKLEAELTQQNNKMEILQNSLIKITTEHFQSNVQKERLIGELRNTKEKCIQLQKMLHQKGETTKQKIQKKMQENSNLKSTIIQKTSDLQLKDFYLKQKEQQCQTLQQQSQELKAALASLKTKLRQLSVNLQQSECKSKQANKQIEQLVRERQKKDEKLSQSNFIIISLQGELEEMNNLVQIIQAKEREFIQLRETKNQCQEYYMNELKKQKETINELKKQLTAQRNTIEHLQEQYQSNLQSLSKTNNQKYKYLQTQFSQEKDQFCKRVQQIQTHNKRVVSQYQSRVDKLKEELYQCKQYQKCLSEQGYKKQSIIRNLSKRNEQLQNQLDDFKQKYNKYYQLYQENKAEMGQNAKENQSKLINTMEKSKISQIKQYAFKIGELQRRIDKLRRSEQFDVKSESISRREIKNLIERIFNKVVDVLRDSQIDNKQEYWKDSKVESLY